MKERNGFKFDKRIEVPDPPQGQVVVKFFGEPVFVSAPCENDTFIGNSGITESQLKELNNVVAERGIASLVNQKLQVAKGGKL